MSHASAALTPIGHLRPAKLIVDRRWSICQAAEFYRVSWPTAKRWAERYRDRRVAGTGPVTAELMQDRSSRPLRSPHKTPTPMVRTIVHLRWKKRLGPV